MSGLGDLIAALTRGLGFAPAAGCGCEHRRDLLNKMFPRPRWLRRGAAGRAREAGRRPRLER